MYIIVRMLKCSYTVWRPRGAEPALTLAAGKRIPFTMGLGTFSTLPEPRVPSDRLSIREVTASRIVSSQSSPCARMNRSRSPIRDRVITESKKRYVDNKLNRKLGRVGKEIGTHILHENGTVCVRVKAQHHSINKLMKTNQNFIKMKGNRKGKGKDKFLAQIRQKKRMLRDRVHCLKKKHTKLMKAIHDLH